MTDKEDTKDDDVEVISSEDEKTKLIGEILSNDSSRKILKTISGDKDMTLNEIAQKNNMSLALVTHHLKRMQTAKMIKVTRTEKSVKGQNMKYYLATKQSFLIVPPEKTTLSIVDSVKNLSKFAAIGMAGLVSWMTLKPNGGGGDGDYQLGPIYEFSEDSSTDSERTAENEDDSWSSGGQELPEVKLEDQSGSVTTTTESVPSHSGVQEFELQVDSDAAHTGSISLDRTVYPTPFDSDYSDWGPQSGGAESAADPLIFSIVIPVAVIVIGLVMERVLTRWYNRRRQMKWKPDTK